MSEISVFMKKAEEFLEMAKDAFLKEKYDTTALLSGQAVINANDGLTFKFLKKRASKSHEEALKLHLTVVRIINDSTGRKYLKRLIDARRKYGYTKSFCSKTEAERLLRDANKFISWVRIFIK